MTQPQRQEDEQKETQRHVQLVKYRFGKHQLAAEDTLAKQVYVIKSRPKVVPVDVNIQWLVEQGSGWNSALDRLRYSEKQLFIRRFDPSPSSDFCLIAQLQHGQSNAEDHVDLQLVIYGNDENMCEVYFKNLFLGNHLDVKEEEMGMVMRGWVDTPHEVLFYCGTVHAAFGLWGTMLVEQQLNSLNMTQSQSIAR